MPGFIPLAKEIVDSTSRVAYPDYIGVRDPSFSAAIGVIRHALPFVSFDLDQQSEGRMKNLSARSKRSKDKSSDDTLFARVKRWFHEFI